jgi:hypothetical protein
MIEPLVINGEEWRRREDPDAGLKDGGLWVRRVNHEHHSHRDAVKRPNVQHYGASSPHPTTEQDALLMIAYIHRLKTALGVAPGTNLVQYLYPL